MRRNAAGADPNNYKKAKRSSRRAKDQQRSLVEKNESGSPTHKRLRIRMRGASPTPENSCTSSGDVEERGAATTQLTSSGINPLLVPEILERVVEFVSSAKDLHVCRQVCSDWKNAFSRKASWSGTVQCECYLETRMGYSEREHAFLRKYPDAPVQKIRVRDPGFALSQKSVVDFFEHHGSGIKYLQLDADGWCCVHFKFLMNALFKWCDNLEHIDLYGFDKEKCTGAVEATTCELDKDIPNLKTLRVTGVKESRSLGMVDMVVRLATNLRCFSYTGLGNGGSASCCSTTKNKSRRKKKKHHAAASTVLVAPSPNIRYMRYFASNLATVDFGGVWLTNSDVEEITAAGWPLKKLVIGGISRAEGSVVRGLLESLAGTLEHLDIGGGVSSDEKMQPMMMAGRFFSVKFPVMDRLTTLKLRDICTFRAGTSLGFLAKKLKSLEHLTLATQQVSKFLSHMDVNSVLRSGSCPSTLKSLCLDGDYAKWDNAQAAAVFGKVVSDVSVYCEVSELGELLDAWRGARQLQHLTLHLHVPARLKNSGSGSFNRTMSKGEGLQGYNVNVLRISTDREMVLQLDSLLHGILQGGNACYYRVELHGFTLVDRDAERLACLLAERVNFTRMVNCRVESPRGTLASSSPITVHLPELEFGSFNIDQMLRRYFHAF